MTGTPQNRDDGYLKDITGSSGNHLAGRRIALGITGSVAAVEAPRLARELMRQGAEVHAIMSPAASGIIHPDVMEWATGNPVVTRLTGRVEHLYLAGEWPGRADLVLVAPATANTLGKMAAGIDDTPVTTLVTTALGSGVPVIVAPGMHAAMFHHPVVQKNLAILESLGVIMVGPRLSEGKAKIAALEEIIAAVCRRLGPGTLRGLTVCVTAGPTREFLDPVRVLTNPSTGTMGAALAAEAYRRGARVILVRGPGSAPAPVGVMVVDVTTTAQMAREVERILATDTCHILFMAAAPADFTSSGPATEKVSTQNESWQPLLVPTPKILDRVGELFPNLFRVAFKAEAGVSEEILVERALARCRQSGAQLVAANLVDEQGTGFGAGPSRLLVISPDGNIAPIEAPDKEAIASALFDLVEHHYTP